MPKDVDDKFWLYQTGPFWQGPHEEHNLLFATEEFARFHWRRMGWPMPTENVNCFYYDDAKTETWHRTSSISIVPRSSARYHKRLERADKIAREVRYLISNDGVINGNNASKLVELLMSWMNVAGNTKYDRPIDRP